MAHEAPPGTADAVTTTLTTLVARMRQLGVPVGVEATLMAHRAVLATLEYPASARSALRAVVCGSPADFDAFDTAFADVFGRARADDDAAQAIGHEPAPGPDLVPSDITLPELPEGPPRASTLPAAAAEPGDDEAEGHVRQYGLQGSSSEVAALLDKDVARYTDEDDSLARVLLARLALRPAVVRARRLRHGPRRGQQLDVRRTIRGALRTAGEPLDRTWLRPRMGRRQIVLVCDVSGSMASYTRMLLLYLRATVAVDTHAEAFVFGTRLARVTLDLRGSRPDGALDRMSDAVGGWSGGTQIGVSLAQLNRAHGRRIARGAIVVILSDGCDFGDPAQVDAEMARLRRSTHRVIWVNPLKYRPGYEPLTPGMQAALPHVDRFLEGHSLGSIMQLAATLEHEMA